MELNINSPAYFTNHYGVDDEVYRYCQNLHNYFKTKEYSETLTIIGITPIVAPKEVYNQGLWKEKVQIVSLGTCAMIDVRMDFESYYNANISLIDFKSARTLFADEWPIYTRTNDSCPTQYFEGSNVKSSVISNGCLIEGTVENSVIGRGCVIKKGAVVKDSVILPGVVIGEDARIEAQVVDKSARIVHAKELIADPEKPGYVRRNDTL